MATLVTVVFHQTPFRGNVSYVQSTRFANDFCLVGTVPFDTSLTPKSIFNSTPPVRQRRTVLEQGIAWHPLVGLELLP
jgi:hypothetical protein